MTEAEWLGGKIAAGMLTGIKGDPSERKLRLFASACCRALQDTITPEQIHAVIDVAERVADGQARGDERKRAWKWARQREAESDTLVWEVGGAWAQPLHLHAFAARIATAALAPHGETAKAIQALLSLQWPQAVCCAPLAHDVFGNPFRPVSFNPLWRSPDVCSLAGPAYQERLLPCGRLEPARLAVLADALEDAGCTSDEVLGHLRGPGPHVRGCWALDLTLGFR